MLQSTIEGGAHSGAFQRQFCGGHISLRCRQGSLRCAKLRLTQEQIIRLTGTEIPPLALRLQVPTSFLGDALSGGGLLRARSGNREFVIRLLELQQDVSRLKETPVQKQFTHGLYFAAHLSHEADTPHRLYRALGSHRDAVACRYCGDDVNQRAPRLGELGRLGLWLTHQHQETDRQTGSRQRRRAEQSAARKTAAFDAVVSHR